MQLKTYITYDNQSANDKQEGIAEVSKKLDVDVREFQLQHPDFSYFQACKHLIKANSQKYAQLCNK